MKKKRTALWGAPFYACQRLCLMTPCEVLKKIWQNEFRASRLTVYLLACLVLGGASAVFGEVLPPQVSINPDAGCGGWLSGGWLEIKLHLETGEEVVFCVDTGAPITIVDDSLLPKLGKRVGAMRANFVGRKPQIAGIYKAPRLLLGNVPLSNCGFVACMHQPKKFKKHCQGVLGMDCLQDYCIQLDFVAGKMRFLDSTAINAAAWGKMYPLTFSRTGPQKQFIQPFIHQAGFFGNNTNLLIDTGCHADGLVYK